MKHVPGPWSVEHVSKRTWRLSCAQWKYFAEVYGNQDADLHEAGKGNVQLIAEAPDLLEALQNIVEVHDCRSHSSCSHALKAIAAIARATGEKP